MCLENECFEDLLQECLVHWFFTKAKYQKEESTQRTFLNRIIRHKLADIARLKMTNKRKSFYLSQSLDAMDEDGEFDGKKEKILMIENHMVEEISVEDLPSAMARAMAGLSFRQKQLCRLLSEGMSLVKAGERMNIPRTTLQDEIKRIREAFKKEGLEEYLG